MTQKVSVNSFAQRHWSQTGLSTTTLTPEELVSLVEEHFDNQTPGYKDGVILVNVPAETFLTPLRKLEVGDELIAKFEARRDNEEAVINVLTTSGHIDADKAEIVLYRHDVLQGDASSEAEWEIVSINASCISHGEVPMNPIAMARNFLQKEGGTSANYTAEEFAKAVWFWATHAMGV